MAVYLAILPICILLPELCKVFSNKYTSGLKKEYKTSVFYFIVMSVYMIIIIGLRRTDIGIDTSNYASMYKSVGELDFSDLKYEMNDKGFVVLQMIFNRLHIGFSGFNFIYAMYVIAVVSCYIYKESEMPWLSYFLYVCFGFFILDFTMVRQTLAMAIVLMAFMIDKNRGVKDFILFALLVILASTIHASAIIFMPVWFIKKLPFNSLIVAFLLILIPLCYLFKGQLTGFLVNMAGNVSDKYEGYSKVGEGSAGILLYLMMLVTVVFSLFVPGLFKDKKNATLFYLLCIMLVIFPGVQGGGAIMRIYYYFYMFMIVFIPNMVCSLDTKEKGFFVLIVFLYLAVGLYMYHGSLTSNNFKIVPYHFYWESYGRYIIR